MARKTISMTIGTGIDEQLNALSEQYGLNKSSLVNRILQRTFACDHAIQNLMAVRPADRSRTIKRSYRIEEEIVAFMEQYPDLSMGTVIEKAVVQLMERNDQQKREFLFSWMCPTWTQGVRGETLPFGKEKRTEAAICASVRFCVYGEEI